MENNFDKDDFILKDKVLCGFSKTGKQKVKTNKELDFTKIDNLFLKRYFSVKEFFFILPS